MKAKAHKLFSKGQSSLEESNEQSSEPVVETFNPVIEPAEPELIDDTCNAILVGNGVEESSELSEDEDSDNVCFF